MKILIFGACGAIGKYLVDYFYERREEKGLSLLTADINECEFIKKRSEYYRIDISDYKQVNTLPKDIDCIIDLATVMPARMQGFNHKKYVDVNIGGTMNILEFCRNNNVSRLLFAQTFGDILQHAGRNPYLCNEMTPSTDYKDTKSVYITSMNTSVELIKCYHALYGLKSFIFRLPTIHYWTDLTYCEEGKATKEGYRVMIDQAINGEDIYAWGDPMKKKDMIYVKDLCQMFYKASFVGRDYGFYNVGTGIGITLLDQIKGYVEVFGENGKSNILFAPEKRNAPEYIMCIDEARNELGYEPKYSFVEMLKDMKKEREMNRFSD